MADVDFGGTAVVAARLDKQCGDDSRICCLISEQYPENAAYRIPAAAGDMKDKKRLVPARRRYGNSKAYTAFTTSTSDDSLLDHVCVKKKKREKCLSHTLSADQVRRRSCSDHRPIACRCANIPVAGRESTMATHRWRRRVA